MIFVLSVLAVFVAISIYFYFRAEKLQHQIILAKSESASLRKENKALVDSMALISNRYEHFYKSRLQALDKIEEHEEMINIISPLINNYGTIFSECLKGSGRLKGITQKCYNHTDAKAFQEFIIHIDKSEQQIKRMWTSNNLNGFISLVEALLVKALNLGKKT